MLWKRQNEEAAVSGLVWPPSVSDLLFFQQYPCEFFREEYEEKWPGRHTQGVQMHLGHGVKAPLPSKWNG